MTTREKMLEQALREQLAKTCSPEICGDATSCQDCDNAKKALAIPADRVTEEQLDVACKAYDESADTCDEYGDVHCNDMHMRAALAALALPADPSDSSPVAGDGVTAEQLQLAMNKFFGGVCDRDSVKAHLPRWMLMDEAFNRMQSAILATGLPDELAKLRAHITADTEYKVMLRNACARAIGERNEARAALAERDAQLAEVRKDAERISGALFEANLLIRDMKPSFEYVWSARNHLQCSVWELELVKKRLDAHLAAQKDKP